MSQPSIPRLSDSDVRHIAKLCRIGLTDEEVETLRGQLSHILEQFEALREVDTTDIPPTEHAISLHSVMRDDEPTTSSTPEEMLSNAPLREADYIRVKAVLE